MALADLTKVLTETMSLIGATPGAYAATVSSGIGAWPSTTEIQDACLRADELVATAGYFNSVNDSLANAFQIASSPGNDGDSVPYHHGQLSKVQVSKKIQTFTTISVANQIPLTNHGLATGQLVSFVTTGTLPTGLAINTNYWVIKINDNVISVASTLLNALAGTATSITISTGSGTHTIIAWRLGVEAQDLDDITNAINGMADYIGAGADDGSYDFLYKASDGNIYTTADFWRTISPVYTRTSTLQCNANEEWLIIFTAAAMLARNASPALFQLYDGYSQRGIQQLIADGTYTRQNNEIIPGD